MAKEKKQELVCKCKNNYSWLFWIIFLCMIGYLIYFVVTTVQSIQENPEEWFQGSEGIIGMARALVSMVVV